MFRVYEMYDVLNFASIKFDSIKTLVSYICRLFKLFYVPSIDLWYYLSILNYMSIMLFVSNIDFIIYLITKYLLLVVCSVTYLINVVIVFNMSIMFQVF